MSWLEKDSSGTSDPFDAYQVAHGRERPYQHDEEWPYLFDSITDCIVRDIRPSTVLDVGCGMGLRVEALRKRGVEAFGVDVSEYAVQDVQTDAKPYCWVASITEPFPDNYDLVVCIGALEYVHPEDADRVVANLCQHTDDVLFSLAPLHYKEAMPHNVHPTVYWAELFARHGFFHDVDFDASLVTPRAARFRRASAPLAQMIATYEEHLWRLEQETQARRDLNIEQSNELAAKEHALLSLRAQLEERKAQIDELRAHLREWERRWAALEASMGWALLQRLQRWRARLAPPGSDRERLLEAMFQVLRTRGSRALADVMTVSREVLTRQAKIVSLKARLRPRHPHGKAIQIEPIQSRASVQAHRATVDIIICVHNAPADVQRCLESVLCHTVAPYSLILVDDGSDTKTSEYLASFAPTHEGTLLRNEEARGYTRAANQGLRQSSADYVVLLNSDTVVTPRWLDRLVACAESDPEIGLVGPLSNTASWQSIPEIELHGDWAANPLPPGLTVEEMGRLVAQYSGRLYPSMPLLNGFCLLIRRQVIREVGYFDEGHFGAGYGEEDDYALRARKAGWRLAVADDAYVYHAQSRSYSDEARRRLTDRAGATLAEKHGPHVIQKGVSFCRQSRVLEGIRARSRVMMDRQEWIQIGRERFAGRRVLFVLPIAAPGGGGNVVIDEAMAMREMGVDTEIFNLTRYQDPFEDAYPSLEIPTRYGTKEDLTQLAKEYDAILATHNTSVGWLRSIAPYKGHPTRGYYIQGFEPYMYPPDSEDFQKAWESYNPFPDLVRLAKTEWTRGEVRRQIGVETTVVGSSVNVDLFRPRPRSGPEWPDRPLRIAAMIRPNSPYRAPKLTMELLQQASREYHVETVIFGTSLEDPGFGELPRNFPWSLAGVLGRRQVARLLNDVDIFVDFSSHQAMGLTAMEAMACGATVIVPERGGAVSFARHEENSLVVDTSSSQCCWDALQRLIEEHNLRIRLQRNALTEICDFFPERPAFNVLSALFDLVSL